MYRRLTLGVTAAAVLVGLAGTGAAEAAPVWTRTANTTQNAYSVNWYKAKVGPSAAPAVTGYTAYSKTVSIQNSAGTGVASNVAYKWLGPGTYKVYSTFKYRKSVPYTVTVTASATANLSELTNARCTLTSLAPSPDYPNYYYTGTATCTGTYAGHAVSGTVKTDYIYTTVAANTVVGAVFASGDDLFNEFVSSSADASWSYKTTATKYKYVYAASQHRYRYATVVKIYNPPTATYNEFKAIIAPSSMVGGHTLAQVRAIIGSYGTLSGYTDYGDHVFYAYDFKNSAGSIMDVGFWDGRAYFKTWYTW